MILIPKNVEQHENGLNLVAPMIPYTGLNSLANISINIFLHFPILIWRPLPLFAFIRKVAANRHG